MLSKSVFFSPEDSLDAAARRHEQSQPSLLAMVPPPPVGHQGGDDNCEACRLVSVNLSAYMDNELDAEQTTLINNHLYQCSDCAALLESMENTESAIQREWRDRAPLPLSSDFRHAVDGIMDALPPVTREEAPIAPKRIHARARWTRFAAGISGMVLFASLLWSSYQLGYTHGRHSLFHSSLFRPGSMGSSRSSIRDRFSSRLSSSTALQSDRPFSHMTDVTGYIHPFPFCKFEMP